MKKVLPESAPSLRTSYTARGTARRRSDSRSLKLALVQQCPFSESSPRLYAQRLLSCFAPGSQPYQAPTRRAFCCAFRLNPRRHWRRCIPWTCGRRLRRLRTRIKSSLPTRTSNLSRQTYSYWPLDQRPCWCRARNLEKPVAGSTVKTPRCVYDPSLTQEFKTAGLLISK
jgi:hypothetical protein